MDRAFFDKLTGWRRHLHENPELSTREHKTAAFVRARLDELGIPYVAQVGGEGIVATLSRAGSNRSVALRADMDALPINERNALPYASKTPGVMHACGHDGHTVSLLGAAEALLRDDNWKGTIRLIFQPSEENGAGARAMLEDGLFERFPAERVFGFHNWPDLAAGTVAVHHGAVMAAGGLVSVTLHGHAGHGARPHLTRDPITAAGHLIVALQSVLARNVDPFDSVVLTFGQINGGMAPNQIPGSVTLVGTLRTYDAGVREAVIKRMEHIIDGIAAAFEMRAEYVIGSTGRATVNSPDEAALAVVAAQTAGLAVTRNIRPSTAGEDFAQLLAERPGAYVWIGNGPAGQNGELHNDCYNFNDDILPATVGWMAGVARLALADAPQG